MQYTASDQGPFLRLLRSLGAGLLTLFKDRVELLSVELQEEKLRLIQIFAWISAAVFTAFMSIAFASLSLVYVFWESARLAVMVGLSVFYAIVLLIIMISFRRYLEHQPKPFAGSIEEIKEDIACIRPKN